jgi:hypothetical protein
LDLDWGIAMQPSTASQLVRTADGFLQAASFEAIEAGARHLGFGSVLDAWRPAEVTLMRADL